MAIATDIVFLLPSHITYFHVPLDLDLSLFPLNTSTIKMKFGQILLHLIKHFSHVFGSILDTRN